MLEILNADQSYSRLSSFDKCQLAWRYNYIDKLPQRPKAVLLRGNVVHTILESVLGLEGDRRTYAEAELLVDSTISDYLARQPENALAIDSDLNFPHDGSAPSGIALEKFKGEVLVLLSRYFTIDKAPEVDVEGLELEIRGMLGNDISFKGFVDRLQRSPSGDLVVVDYKTGKKPSDRFMGDNLKQLQLYALVLRRAGKLVQQLRLFYLGGEAAEVYERQILDEDLIAVEQWAVEVDSKMKQAITSKTFTTNSGPLCNYCDFKALCPAFGATALPLPELR